MAIARSGSRSAGAVELRRPPVQRVLERLIELGCTHELLRPSLVAIDLPPRWTWEVGPGAAGGGAGGRLAWEWADPRPS